MAYLTKLPSRLHHTAYVTRDLEATRHFYENVIGLPLVATWCEADEIKRVRLANAHSELKRWVAGDHTSNNTYR